MFTLRIGNNRFNISCQDAALLSPPILNEIWRVKGEHILDKEYGPLFKIDEGKRIPLSSEIEQSIICDYLIQHPSFSCIGKSWVKKLDGAFPYTLKNTLNTITASEITSHSKVKMPVVLAEILLDRWQQCNEENKLITFIIFKKIPISLLSQLIKFFGYQAIDKINNDPYRLLALMPIKDVLSQWRLIDSIASESFGIKEVDPRRIVSAIEAILYQYYDTEGHMAMPICDVEKALHNEGIEYKVNRLIHGYMQESLIINSQSGLIQSAGSWFLENVVIKRLNSLFSRTVRKQITFQNDLLKDIEKDLALYKGVTTFEFNEQQVKAIKLAVKSRFSVINGVVYTGKKTVLMAIARYYFRQKKNVFVLSNAESVLREMKSDGIDITDTFISFIGRINELNQGKSLSQALIIIDSASLLDMPYAYNLLKKIPNDCSICLIGDSRLLPPPGPGLFFHQISNDSNLSITLKSPYKLKVDSNINQFRYSIINKDTNALKNDLKPYNIDSKAPVSWLSPQDKSSKSLCKAALNVWFENQKNSAPQIFGATENICNDINTELQLFRTYKQTHSSIKAHNTVFIEGDPVIYERNNHELGINTGSLGRVSKVFTDKRIINKKECVIKVNFKHDSKYLAIEDCLHLKLAYCINVFKGQGNVFKDIIVVIDSNSSQMDNSWLYTASYFAKKSMILISDYNAIEECVLASKNGFQRQVGTKIEIKETL
jgi:exodeoxyribonuclease V alpha subunit